MKTFVIFCTLASVPVFACIPEPTYVDLENIQEFANISTENSLIIRSTEAVRFEHNSSVKVDKIVPTNIGGLFLYEITPSSRPLKAKLIANKQKKKVFLNITLSKKERTKGPLSVKSISKGGGCGKPGKVEYH